MQTISEASTSYASSAHTYVDIDTIIDEPNTSWLARFDDSCCHSLSMNAIEFIIVMIFAIIIITCLYIFY